MTGLKRTLAFLEGASYDRPPFHPIIMRWAARYAGVKYRDFCTVPEAKCYAMVKCAREMGIDWVTVMSDPWAEASAFGIEVEYPEDNLPVDKSGHMPDAQTVSLLKKYDPLVNERCRNRLKEIEEYRKKCGDEYFIVGWVEGSVAEYCDLRGASNASVDFLTNPGSLERALDLIVEAAIGFISLQVEAGAHCIGIGDSFCSQIGPELYSEFAFQREKILVDHIHREGALAKLHICGDTSPILPLMIKTGADIIDVDHLVPSMNKYSEMLGKWQVFSGKSDPVTVIQDGSAELINNSVKKDFMESGGRCIVSAGCEITPGTSLENMRIFSRSPYSLIHA
jgi:uroporphyrinogen decarboxylase